MPACARIVAAAIALGVLSDCGSTPLAQPDATTALPGPAEVTWYANVGKVIHAKCAGCHQPDGTAPFSLLELDDAREHLPALLTAIDERRMPPFYADTESDCAPRRPWRDDPRLTVDEVTMLHAWSGAAGEPGDLAGPPDTQLAGVTRTLRPSVAFTSSGDGDQFICYLFDPAFTTTTYVTSLQVRPTLPALVHHANISVIPPEQASEVLQQFGPLGAPRPCSHGGPGILMHDWAPGNQPLSLPTDIAIPLRVGSLIGVQLHYHSGGVGGSDASEIDLVTTTTPAVWRYAGLSLGNVSMPPGLLPGDGDPPSGPAFLIPANATDHVETMQLTIGAEAASGDTRLVTITPHAHLLATHVRATIDRVNGEHECLATGRWSFDWQRTFGYGGAVADLPRLSPGDVVTVSCHWNNSFSNPNLPRMLHDAGLVAPADVRLGGSTTDEMCVANVGIAVADWARPLDAPPPLR